MTSRSLRSVAMLLAGASWFMAGPCQAQAEASLSQIQAGQTKADTQVGIDNFTFSPASITVSPGTRVEWTNHDDIPHTVVDQDDPHAMKSPPLDTGEQFSFVFRKAGIFHYFCSLHPHMQGTVIVH